MSADGGPSTHEGQVSGEGPGFHAWQGLRPALTGIPLALTAVEQWVLWRATPKPNGGMNKIPVQPNGRNASATDPSTWSDFGTTWTAYEEDPASFGGVGFVLSAQDDFIGGDLDHCVDVESGALTPLAERIVSGLGTYAERSPSGTGIRFIGRGELGKAFKGQGVEVYGAARFVTITGYRLDDSPEDPQPLDPRHIARLREIATGRRENGVDTGGQGSDPVIARLKERGLYQRQLQDGRHLVTCPWSSEHSGGDTTGTVYMEAHHGGHAQPQFVCQHSHCGDKRLRHLVAFLGLQDAPGEPKTYPLIWMADASPRIAEASLVRGVIKPGSMVVTYGESNSGKTFHVLDRDICMARGQPWYGRETEPGFVLYVAAEGAHSVENRVSVYRTERVPSDESVPFAILPGALNLLDPAADARPLIDFIRRVEDERGARCIKVTADTLARVMAGGNENAPEDMGALVGNADVIRAEVGCAFEFVHHAGKDTAKGARGHSSLRAATDTEVEVINRDGYHIAKVTKQRDFASGIEFAFRQRVVDLGLDKYGYPVTTCLPEWVLDHDAKTPEVKLAEQPKRLLWLIREGIEARGTYPPTEVMSAAPSPPKMGQKGLSGSAMDKWVEARGGLAKTDKPDSERRAIDRARNTLQQSKLIEVFEDFVWLADKPDKAGQA